MMLFLWFMLGCDCHDEEQEISYCSDNCTSQAPEVESLELTRGESATLRVVLESSRAPVEEVWVDDILLSEANGAWSVEVPDGWEASEEASVRVVGLCEVVTSSVQMEGWVGQFTPAPPVSSVPLGAGELSVFPGVPEGTFLSLTPVNAAVLQVQPTVVVGTDEVALWTNGLAAGLTAVTLGGAAGEGTILVNVIAPPVYVGPSAITSAGTYQATFSTDDSFGSCDAWSSDAQVVLLQAEERLTIEVPADVAGANVHFECTDSLGQTTMSSIAVSSPSE